MKNIIYIICFALILVLSNCGDEFLEEVHPTKATAEVFFENDVQAQEALLSILGDKVADDFYNRQGDGFLTVFDMTRGDNLVQPITGSNRHNTWFTLNYNAETTRGVRDGWQKSYSRIYRANWVIDNVRDNPNISDAVKQRILAEAYFLRGFFYYNLTRLYEEVPLVLTANTLEESNPEKASNEACWAQAIGDMEAAIDGLPNPNPNEINGRPNKGVAYSILARAYMNRTRPGSNQYWDKVQEYAKAAEDLGVYGLEPIEKFSEMFVYTNEGRWINNREVIWAMGFVYGPYDGNGFRYNNLSAFGSWAVMPAGKRLIQVKNENGLPYLPGNGRTGTARFAVSVGLSDIMIGYDALGDKRTREFLWYPSYEVYTAEFGDQGEWVGSVEEVVNTDSLYQKAKETNGSAGEYLHIKKFVMREFIGTNIWDGGWHHSMLYPVIRYADVLLMRAEAEYHLGNEGVAKSYLKLITDRAGFAENYLDSFSGQAFLDELLQQRRVELMFESQRVPDLIRLDMFRPPHVGNNPGSVVWDEKLSVVPVPTRELDWNRNLRQHPLWE